MTSRHHPDAEGPTLYKYDDLGRLRFSQDARQRAPGAGTGKITYTVYDDFGRVTRVGEGTFTGAFASLDPDSVYAFERDSASWRSRMFYDEGDEVADGGPNYARGRLTRIEENTDADAAAEVTHRYAYDHLGNVRIKRVEIEGLAGAKTIEYEHDLAGRVTRLVYPDGSQARYAYDGAGRLSRVRDAEGRTLAAYTHTAAGNIKTHVVGYGVGDGTGDGTEAGVVTGTYAYNAREWVTDLNYSGQFRSTLTYDRVGNVTRQVYRHGTAAAKTADYAYDDLHRITDFDPAGGVSRDFAYDRNGNITRVVTGADTLTYVYPDSSTTLNRLGRTSGTGGMTFGYNKNGSVTSAGGSTLSYDYRGLVTGYGGSHTYTRDSEGYRVKSTGSGGTTYYLRGAGGAVLVEYNGSGKLTSSYVYAGGDRIARLANGAIHYYLKDHLGSTRTLLSSSGTTAVAYDYWPYGQVLATSGTGATRFRFTGHERDSESGFDFMQYRTYKPVWMRFLQMDPLAEKYPGLSPYVYAGNNPLKFIDARGDTLDVGGLNKGRTALSYIHSMFDQQTAKRITMGKGGRVSFDTGGLYLSQDSGLVLLNNMVNGPGMFLFEVGKSTSARYRDSGNPLEMSVSDHPLGIRSFSVTPRNIGTNNPGSGPLPMSGYSGQVALAPGRWTLKGGAIEVPQGDVTFHELSELYHRTIGRMPYIRDDGSGAHSQALKDAERYKNQVVSPLKLREGVTFRPEP